MEDNAVWQTHLKATARRLHSEVFEVAANLLGPDLARQLLALDIAGVSSWEHLQRIEHMLCEIWKMTNAENRGHKLTGNRASLHEYRQLFSRVSGSHPGCSCQGL